MARDTTEVLEQLMSQNMFTVLLYEIQVKDTGTCTVIGTTITDSTKEWFSSEWATDTAIFTDVNGDTFTVVSNTATTLVLNDTPADGEFTIERWFYLSSHIEDIDLEGKPATITYGTDSFGRVKEYIPYPVDHKLIYDHELGKFPQLRVSVYNPGSEAFSAYYDLEAFDFYSLFERYDAFRGNTLKLFIIFIDSTGEIITSPSDANIENYFTIMTSDVKRDAITFTVSSLGNFADKKIPARIFSKITCGWVYKGNKCLYQSSDPSLTTSITRCNKLLRSHVFQSAAEEDTSVLKPGVSLHYESGEGTYAFSFSEEGEGVPADMEDYVLGCIVETPIVQYLWRVTAVDDSILTIQSHTNSKRLNEFLDADDNVKVNIYEKECCYGHADTGTLVATNPLFDNTEKRGYCKYNDLVYNGDFNTFGDYDPLSQWDTTGTISVRSGYAFLEGLVTMEQDLYDAATPDDDLPLDTGKKLNLLFRYYGASLENGVDKNLFWTFRANIGVTRYWNATTKAFQIAPVINSIPLKPYNQRLGIADYTDAQKDDIRYLKFDEYVDTIILESGVSTAEVDDIHLTIATPTNSEVVFNYVSCIVFNQFERFGGFPGIPTSRFWYF